MNSEVSDCFSPGFGSSLLCNGQTVVVGQADGYSVKLRPRGIAGPRSLLVAGSRLFISETRTSSILGWNSVPTDQVNPDFSLCDSCTTIFDEGIQTVSASSFGFFVEGLATDGTRLFVVDSVNSRVLIFNTIPSGPSVEADVVLGQPDFSTSGGNTGGLSQQSLAFSQGIATDGTKLVVADTFNRRVLIWNTIPTYSHQPASVVLGQPDFITNTIPGTAQADVVGGPTRVMIHGGKLYVSDTSFHRVLVWNSIPILDQTPADFAIGQANLTSSTTAEGYTGLRYPGGLTVIGTKLVIADSGNQRVVIFNTLPTASGANASVVFGQDNENGFLPNGNVFVSAKYLLTPSDVATDGTGLWISDYGNNRVLKLNSVPSTNGQSADLVLGQPHFSSNVPFNAESDGRTLTQPAVAIVAEEKLLVSDLCERFKGPPNLDLESGS